MAIQSYNRGVRDMKLALWGPADGAYSPAVDVLGARMANLSWVVESDELRGDDVVLDRYTKLVSASLTIAQAAVDLAIFNMILGGTLTNHAQYYDLMVGDTGEVPFLGIAGRVVGSGGKGDLHFFLPKAKLSGNLQLNAQVDTYLIPQADFQGVHESATTGMLRLRHYNVPTALTIPLATTGGGG